MVVAATVEGAVLAALLEVCLRVFWPQLAHPGLRNVNPHTVWLSPLANAMLLLPLTSAVAAGASLAGRRGRTRAWLRLTSYTYAVAQCTLLIGRIHSVSALLVAAGAGSVLATLTAGPRWQRLVRTVVAAGAVAAAGWALWIPVSRQLRYASDLRQLPASPDSAPNVLLLILDTVSADEMSLYGYPRPTTPVLDSLARHGVVFDRAFSAAPWTLPSHSSMFTGRNARLLSGRFTRPLDNKFPVVAESFASAGYLTAGFVANLEYASRASGLARGFHWYSDYEPSLSGALAFTALGGKIARRLGAWRGRPFQPGRKDAVQVNADFLEWQRDARRPWFAFLNYYDAHDPYVPPARDERVFLRPGQSPVYDVVGLDPRADERVESARALHDAALLSLDREIGRLLDALRRRGDLERTVIVVTSDHGEEWGKRGVLLHGNSVYLRSLHVPLLIVRPQGLPAGRHVATPVGTRNLGATLLDLAGLPTVTVAGSSLSEYWETAGDRGHATEISWVEQSLNQNPDYPSSQTELFSVITDSMQVILGPDTLVFNLNEPHSIAKDLRDDPASSDEVSTALRVIARLVSGR
jgi:arylsulfatase A-like enzyme